MKINKNGFVKIKIVITFFYDILSVNSSHGMIFSKYYILHVTLMLKVNKPDPIMVYGTSRCTNIL